jgi:hypothetical protein
MINGIIHSGQEIVTNGLVFHLDAAQLRSYPTTGTTWTDLSGGGNNGTLTNGPTFNSANGGSIVFDGVNDFASITGTITTSEATFLAWVRRNGNQRSSAGIIFSRGANVSGMNYYLTTNQIGYHWNDDLNTYNWSSGLVPPNLQWAMCVITVSSASAVAYLCQSSGITSATNNVSHGSTTLNTLRLAFDSFISQNRCMNGNIAMAMLYSRALSSVEITQNYNATKSRFGL